MRDGPSRTALGAARHRAIHQVVDGVALFEDPFALPIAGFAGPGEAEEAAAARPGSAPMRWFIAARSRFAQGDTAVVLWLGVLPYLSLDAVTSTLRALAGLGRVEVVLDYGEPLADRTGPARDVFLAGAARVAGVGEPWVTFLTPAQLRRLLGDTGFVLVEDVDVVTYVAAALGRPRPDRRSPAHLVHARTGA